MGRLCDALGKPEWKDKPEWSTQLGRTKDRPALNQAVSEVTLEKPSAYWWEKFEAAGIPAGPINMIDKVFADPQVQHLGIAAPISTPVFGDTKFVANPVNVDGLKRELRIPTPEPGAHTEEVMRWLGYTSAEIDRLNSTGVTQPREAAQHI